MDLETDAAVRLLESAFAPGVSSGAGQLCFFRRIATATRRAAFLFSTKKTAREEGERADDGEGDEDIVEREVHWNPSRRPP